MIAKVYVAVKSGLLAFAVFDARTYHLGTKPWNCYKAVSFSE